jgi:hypothetical protein
MRFGIILILNITGVLNGLGSKESENLESKLPTRPQKIFLALVTWKICHLNQEFAWTNDKNLAPENFSSPAQSILNDFTHKFGNKIIFAVVDAFLILIPELKYKPGVCIQAQASSHESLKLHILYFNSHLMTKNKRCFGAPK